MRKNDDELIERTKRVCDELMRYGDYVWCDSLLDVVEMISAINTDLHHGIRGELLKDKVEETKKRLEYFLLESITDSFGIHR